MFVKLKMDETAGMEVEEAKKFLDFYENTIDNHKNSFKYHLADTAVLDWFGKTVKGARNISIFLNTKANCTHHFTDNVKPVEKIGFRDTHVINLQKKTETKVPDDTRSYTNFDEHTPPNPTTSADFSQLVGVVEQGQGDGMHNNCLETLSPVKKSRVNDAEDLPVKYLVAEGCLKFTGCSGKKLQRETRWSRPCKLHIGYTQTGFEDNTIYLMIYEGNVKCRRNLMKDFEATTSKHDETERPHD